jgi:uncharacterized protein YcgI (DUF1989 family)
MDAFKLAQSVDVPASHGRALRVGRGERLRIIDVEGRQVGDLAAWRADDPSEYLSPSHTVTQNWRITLRPGDALATNRRNDMFRVVADTVGYHDMVVPCCDSEAYLRRYGLADHRSCKSNLEEALAAIGLDYPVRGELALNLFMKTRIGPGGEMVYEEPTHGPGSHIDLDCLMDVVIALSACPQDQTPTNGWKCTPMRLERWTPAT